MDPPNQSKAIEISSQPLKYNIYSTRLPCVIVATMKFPSPLSSFDSSASFPPHVVESRSARADGTNQETFVSNGRVIQSRPTYSNVLHI
jgi:hypothetical protein